MFVSILLLCRIEVCHFAEELIFEVRDKDHAYTEYIGAVVIPTHSIMHGEVKEGWFPILKRNKLTQRGTLHVRVQFISQVRTPSIEIFIFKYIYTNNAFKLFYTQQHCFVSLKTLYPGGI
jgi:hypothetical protein